MNARIVSRLPGRLRLRAREWRHAGCNEALCREFLGWDGMLSAEGNANTGGILLRYDIGQVDPATMEARVAGRLSETRLPAADADPDETLWRMNRYAKWGMLGSLTGTLVALAVGKRAHAAFGALHLAFLLVHLANHRNRLLK